jgi:hypothetical protein
MANGGPTFGHVRAALAELRASRDAIEQVRDQSSSQVVGTASEEL